MIGLNQTAKYNFPQTFSVTVYSNVNLSERDTHTPLPNTHTYTHLFLDVLDAVLASFLLVHYNGIHVAT